MATVYLGIGSNMGDRLQNIDKAKTLLRQNGIDILQISSIIETDPVGGPPQGLFLNGALKVRTSLSPRVLLDVLKKIELEMGRIKTVQDGPRPIDIDILLYDDVVMMSPTLTIPHPRIKERAFVMTPLREIFPEIDQVLR